MQSISSCFALGTAWPTVQSELWVDVGLPVRSLQQPVVPRPAMAIFRQQSQRWVDLARVSSRWFRNKIMLQGQGHGFGAIGCPKLGENAAHMVFGRGRTDHQLFRNLGI